MQRMIITGATSMIGISLIEATLKKEFNGKIYAVIRKHSSNILRLPIDSRIKVIECDADSYAMLPQLIHEKCDVFYHIAWTATGCHRDDNIAEQERNIAYTLEAVNAAYVLGCKKFIGAGSQAEYGPKNIDRISPNLSVEPAMAYGVTKYAAGKLARMQAERYRMDCLWVRIFSVYGKYEKESTMIQSTIRKLQAGERPSFTPAEQRWDYLYSEDAGNAFYEIGKKAKGNKVYCLGSGQARPLKEYIQIMQKIINPTIVIGIGDLPYPKNAVMNLCADIRELQRDTGWKPVTSFENGILQILNEIRGDITL